MARFADPHRIAVKTQRGEEHSFAADKIRHRGRHRAVPAGQTSRSTTRNVFDSDDIATEPHVPRSLTVVGAGVIGIEYATIFSALDVPVTIIEPRENFLEFIDREIIDEFMHDLRKRGIQFRLGAKVERVELDEQGYASASCPTAGGSAPRCCSMPPAGSGATANLGLEACGHRRPMTAAG